MKVAMTCRFQMNLGAGGTKVSIRENDYKDFRKRVVFPEVFVYYKSRFLRKWKGCNGRTAPCAVILP